MGPEGKENVFLQAIQAGNDIIKASVMRLIRGRCPAVVLLLVALFLGGCVSKARKVSVTSTPEGAVVYLDGRELGITPFEATIEERQGDFNIYEFYAVKQDYLPERKAYKEELYYQTVADVVPEAVHFGMRLRLNHSVRVTSEPAGGIVTLDEVERGTTPCDLVIEQSVKEPRSFAIKVKKEGYRDSVKVVTEVVSKKIKGAFELPEAVHLSLERQQ